MAERIEEHPHGLPQLAIYRRFGVSHCRILVQLQIEITQLEKYLSEIDSKIAQVNQWLGGCTRQSFPMVITCQEKSFLNSSKVNY
jgi:hypothetical protein